MHSDTTDTDPWPIGRLTAIGRLRALAGALPGVALAETVLDHDYPSVWGFIADLERSVPAFEAGVERFTVVERRSADRFRARVEHRVWRIDRSTTMEVELTDGWCWMSSRPNGYVVGMAATAEGDRTRFAIAEGLAVPVNPLAGRLARPLLRATTLRHVRHVRRDLAGVERAIAHRTGDDPNLR